jgi:hypothetical protein
MGGKCFFCEDGEINQASCRLGGTRCSNLLVRGRSCPCWPYTSLRIGNSNPVLKELCRIVKTVHDETVDCTTGPLNYTLVTTVYETVDNTTGPLSCFTKLHPRNQCMYVCMYVCMHVIYCCLLTVESRPTPRRTKKKTPSILQLASLMKKLPLLAIQETPDRIEL